MVAYYSFQKLRTKHGWFLSAPDPIPKSVALSGSASVQNTSFLQPLRFWNRAFDQLPPNAYYVLLHSQGYKDQLLVVTVLL